MSSDLDHKAAVLEMHAAGWSYRDIATALRLRGYFHGKDARQTSAFIIATIFRAEGNFNGGRRKQSEKKPVESEKVSRVDEMLRLSSLMAGKKRYSL